jgi:hypothetical protein
MMTNLGRYEEESAIERLDENTWFQLVGGTLPYSGGVMGVIAKKAQRIKEERLRTFLASVTERVAILGDDKIDRSFLDSPEFYGHLEFVWGQVAGTNEKQKIEYLRRFFVRGIQSDRPDTTIMEILRKYLMNLYGAHLAVLALVFEKKRNVSLTDRSQATRAPGPQAPVDLDELSGHLPSYEKNLLRALAVDLFALGLLGDWGLSNRGGIQNRFFLTENGRAFMAEMERTSGPI